MCRRADDWIQDFCYRHFNARRADKQPYYDIAVPRVHKIITLGGTWSMFAPGTLVVSKKPK